MDKTLDDWRQEIDRLDDELLNVLSQRFAIVQQIGKLKKAKGIPPLAEQRWQQLLHDKLTKAKKYNLPEKFIGRLYNLIHQYALELQVDQTKMGRQATVATILKIPGLTVGYLGPEGTYSQQAAEKLFMDVNPQLIAYQTIYDIFEAVAAKDIAVGVVPAENSTEGTVRETLDYLLDFDLHINASLDLPIHHCLLTRETEQKNIKKVFAHPQALAQCRQWLRKQLPSAQLETATSTIAGITHCENEKGVALIGPKSAAMHYHLQILAENIQDNPNNITRFYVISDKDIYEGTKKTLLFINVLNRVGVLRDILTVFATCSINLTKLESRPSKTKMWDYSFFIEVDHPPSDPSLHHAIHLLQEYCQTIAIIGGIY